MAGDERWPSWTPDGRLVFAHRDVEPAGRPADPSLQWDLFLVAPVAGSEAWQAPLPLTETTDSETYPRVSPDGTRRRVRLRSRFRRRRRPVVDAGAVRGHCQTDSARRASAQAGVVIRAGGGRAMQVRRARFA